jgi:hypothetical protein
VSKNVVVLAQILAHTFVRQFVAHQRQSISTGQYLSLYFSASGDGLFSITLPSIGSSLLVPIGPICKECCCRAHARNRRGRLPFWVSRRSPFRERKTLHTPPDLRSRLTKSVALEFAKQNIRINAIAPGVIATEMFVRFAGDELRDQIVSIVPVGRVGASDEIAAAVLYLASDAAKFTTGTSLVVDGGFIAG